LLRLRSGPGADFCLAGRSVAAKSAFCSVHWLVTGRPARSLLRRAGRDPPYRSLFAECLPRRAAAERCWSQAKPGQEEIVRTGGCIPHLFLTARAGVTPGRGSRPTALSPADPPLPWPSHQRTSERPGLVPHRARRQAASASCACERAGAQAQSKCCGRRIACSKGSGAKSPRLAEVLHRARSGRERPWGWRLTGSRARRDHERRPHSSGIPALRRPSRRRGREVSRIAAKSAGLAHSVSPAAKRRPDRKSSRCSGFRR
jgi:hypothetical protein